MQDDPLGSTRPPLAWYHAGALVRMVAPTGSNVGMSSGAICSRADAD